MQTRMSSTNCPEHRHAALTVSGVIASRVTSCIRWCRVCATSLVFRIGVTASSGVDWSVGRCVVWPLGARGCKGIPFPFGEGVTDHLAVRGLPQPGLKLRQSGHTEAEGGITVGP